MLYFIMWLVSISSIDFYLKFYALNEQLFLKGEYIYIKIKLGEVIL